MSASPVLDLNPSPPRGLPGFVAVKIRHEESLHPHDAVAVIAKGVRGG